MHLLVTGVTEFVGSHLVPTLSAAGHDVRTIDGTRARPDPVPAGGVER